MGNQKERKSTKVVAAEEAPTAADIDREHLYLEALYKAYFESSAQFDKSVELISTGALFVSFAYIGDIIPYTTAQRMPLLIASWVLLVLAIVAALFSHAHAVRCHAQTIERMDEENPNVRSHVSLLNNLTLILLFLGLATMFIYASVNLLKL